MKFFNKLERKFGHRGIDNLSLYLVIGYVIGYILKYLNPFIYSYLTLSPGLILKGQVWRLVTWIICPPGGLDIFVIIMLFFYYSLGTTLERTWGKFRYTVFIFSGILFTVIGAFILYFIHPLLALPAMFSTYYINLSIFLAFAISYPNMQVNLYFIFPIKIKWIAYFHVIYLLFEMITNGWTTRILIIASLLNVIIFFLFTRDYKRISPKEIHRRQKYVRAVKRPKGDTQHKCAICGRTEKDGDYLEFRYCSKCDGNYEYCQDHLFTHQHIKKDL